MPGLLVALVFSGAQVMTVTGSSLDPPAEPGMTPHAAVRDAHAATRAAALINAVLEGRGNKVRRETGMVMHDSAAVPTME
ncbi:hypothetical protein GCM10010449_35210 [Streptomyces rectiviolaceus]|uniref:Uncharacterized protein n=1 Tax=Streptomyces rectiviolaceus TaxID=332591 RepID=A0ABP6MFI5_9ACTN